MLPNQLLSIAMVSFFIDTRCDIRLLGDKSVDKIQALGLKKSGVSGAFIMKITT